MQEYIPSLDSKILIVDLSLYATLYVIILFSNMDTKNKIQDFLPAISSFQVKWIVFNYAGFPFHTAFPSLHSILAYAKWVVST